MIAADIMTSPVITIHEDESVQICAARLIEHRISALPVVDQAGHLLGIISEGDLMRRSEFGAQHENESWWLTWLKTRRSEAAEFITANTQRVGDLMTRNVITADRTCSLSDIASLLDKNRIKRVPIMDNQRMIGLISRANLLHALAASRADTTTMADASTAETDRALRAELIDQLRQQGWYSTTQSNVLVNDGIVELFGVVDSDAERRAAQVVAENTTGVKEVHDHRVVLANMPVVGA